MNLDSHKLNGYYKYKLECPHPVVNELSSKILLKVEESSIELIEFRSIGVPLRYKTGTLNYSANDNSVTLSIQDVCVYSTTRNNADGWLDESQYEIDLVLGNSVFEFEDSIVMYTDSGFETLSILKEYKTCDAKEFHKFNYIMDRCRQTDSVADADIYSN